MFTIKTFDYDCTRKCHLHQHGNKITAALTKRSIDDEKLAAFIAKTCCNFCDVVDDLGRSAVHQAASVNRYSILEWLLNHGAIINSRDFESGSSALHRAIYYGCIDCAVLLLRYGASLELLDEDTRTALQSVCRMCDFPSKVKVAANNDILVWGSNKNYNLGVGYDECANTPQSIDFFRKGHISIEAIALGTYHSLFLDKKAQLYAVGHGKGGLLGIGMESSLPAPQRVRVPIKNAGEHIICISVSRKHSLLLTNRSAVFACGLNEDQQLGVRGAGPKLTVFKEVVTLRDIGVTGLVNVIARDFHSLAYAEYCIYVWGTNHGQMSMNANVKVVPYPQPFKLASGTSIQFLEANNFATAVCTKEDTVLLFYNYKTKSLKAPNFELLKSMALVGGDNSRAGKGSVAALKVLMLTQTNVVFLWYEVTQSFYRCIFSQIRLTQIDKIYYRANQVLILSQGDVYKGKCQQIPVSNVPHQQHADATIDGGGDHQQNKRAASGRLASESSRTIWTRSRIAVSKDHFIRIDLQRLATIDRAVDVFCDEDFTSFAVLQESHMKYFKLPALGPEEYSFKKLHNDVNECDAVHDVVFHVDGESFAAHKFIIYARAPGLRDIIDDCIDKHVDLTFSGLSGKMFELMMKFIYTNYFPNEDDLVAIQQSLGPNSPIENVDICLLFLDFVEKFQLKELTKFLRSYLQQNPFYLPDYVDRSKYRFERLHRTDFPTLYDVRITCSGGVELDAHKCILVARLEYFDMMFTHSWAEKTSISLSTVPVEYMEPILDFLYSSDVEHFRKQQYSETFLYNMIVFCDQFFIDRLKKVCEILILDKITIRKCGAMLDMADTYNCTVLKGGCLDFICHNLARVLMHKSLDCCEPKTLRAVSDHYRQIFKKVFDYRLITPDSEAVEDELLLSFVHDFEVDLDYRMDEDDETSLRKAKQIKDTKSKQSSRQYELAAISSMIESIHLSETDVTNKSDVSTKIIEDAKSAGNRLESEAKNWIKVVDKKHPKNKLNVEEIVKCNEMLKQEEKPKAEFVPLQLNSSVSVEKISKDIQQVYDENPSSSTFVNHISDDSSTSETPTKGYKINFADFKSARDKLSQKQRKRLSSAELQRPSPKVEPQVKSEVITPPPNAWGLLDRSSEPSPLAVVFSSSPPTGSSADPSSFANMMRSGDSGKRDHEQPLNSFSRIIAEEKQQREYYNRMRSKSLALTQIEETAIAELRQFYNVDNVDDEVITIERKPMPKTMNFAVWQHN